MIPINLVYLAVGSNPVYHSQLAFSVISVIANNQTSRDVNIHVVTDKPEYYSWLSSVVEVVHVDEDKLKHWRGKYDFFFLTKIEAIKQIAERCGNEHLLFLDTDTAIYDNLVEVFSSLDEGKNYLHKWEYDFSKRLKGRKAENIRCKTLGKSFAGYDISGKTAMWNSGVVGVSNENNPAEVLNGAKELCNSILETGLRETFVEQLSLAIAVTSSGETLEADSHIKHYWGNKVPWDEMVNKFLSQCAMLGLDPMGSLKIFKQYDLTIPEYVKEPKLTKYKNSISKRYRRIVGSK
ncbi:hypothetical protein [Vibrio sp. TRT 29B02]|uniref:hypothetical protein n=1 Tax=Vibrio sp. TRT 29B02 TaxID=3418508 RepID=UPI003CF966E5